MIQYYVFSYRPNMTLANISQHNPKLCWNSLTSWSAQYPAQALGYCHSTLGQGETFSL